MGLSQAGGRDFEKLTCRCFCAVFLSSLLRNRSCSGRLSRFAVLLWCLPPAQTLGLVLAFVGFTGGGRF